MAHTKPSVRNSQTGRPYHVRMGVQPLATPTPSDPRSTATPTTESTEAKDEEMNDTLPSRASESADNTSTPTAAVRTYVPTCAFAQQRTRDRNAAEKSIAKSVTRLQKSGEWAHKTVEGRRQFILRRYRAVIETRAAHPRWGSTRSHFPEQHDERAEEDWVMGAFDQFLEPELRKAGGVVAAPSRYAESEGSDDEEVMPGDEIAVQTEREPDEDEGAPGATDVEGTEESDGFEIAIAKAQAQLGASRKRRLSDAEMGLEGKRMRVGHGGQIMHKAAEQAGKEEVLYVAVSRGMVISEVSRARRERAAAGWPWAIAGKTGALGGGE